MSYAVWNDLLFSHFFNIDNSETPVIIYVDEDLLEEIGKNIGGTHGFIESVIYDDRRPLHLVHHLTALAERKNVAISSSVESPPYFAALCLTILAWTVDPLRHSGNYYDRLNGLMAPVYAKRGHCAEDFAIGRGTNQRLTDRFRSQLTLLFKSLEEHTIETLDMRLGYSEFRQVGTQYVGIPKAHALVSARDRVGLERFFFQQGLQAGMEIAAEFATKLMLRGALHTEYMTQATIGRWHASEENQQVISEIVVSLVKNWDGAFETQGGAIGGEGSSGQKRRHVGAYLRPSLRSNSLGQYELVGRVEFTNGDFPTRPLFLDSFGVEANRQFEGWSRQFPLKALHWESLQSSPGSRELYRDEACRISWTREHVYLLTKAPHLGGFIPSKFYASGFSYMVLIDDQRSTAFLNANQGCLTPVPLSPPVSGWSLYESTNDLKDLDQLGEFHVRPSSRVLALSGGARIGHALRQRYCVVVPPRVELLAPLPQGAVVAYKRPLRATTPLEEEDGLFQIPAAELEPDQYEVILCDSNLVKLGGFDTLTFYLLDCSMPIGGHARSSDFEDLPDFTEFLYGNEPLPIELRGGTNIPGDNHTFVRRVGGPFLEAFFDKGLDGLSLRCQSSDVPVSDAARGVVLPDLDAGDHSLVALWHGVQIGFCNISMVSLPCVKVDVIGAIPASADGSVWLVKAVSELPTFRLSISGKQGYHAIAIVNGSRFALSEGFNALECSSLGIHRVSARWRGIELCSWHFSIALFPDVAVAISSNTGRMWSGSTIWDPQNPPVIEVLLDDRTLLSPERIDLHLGRVSLILDSDDGTILRYKLPTSYRVEGENLPVTIGSSGVDVPLEGMPKLTLFSRPSLQLRIEGSELAPGVFSVSRPPQIRLVDTAGSVHTSRAHAYRLEMNNQVFTVAPDDDFQPLLPNLKAAQKELQVLIRVLWYTEEICRSRITLRRQDALNVVVQGGTRLNGLGEVYLGNDPPRIVRVEFTEVATTDLRVRFGLAGEPRVELQIHEPDTFLLPDIKWLDGKTYLIEVWQSQVKLRGASFRIAGPECRSIGFFPGQVADIYSGKAWLACWVVQKFGKNDISLCEAGNCPKGEAPCPCPGVLSASKGLPEADKEDKKRWLALVQRGGQGVSASEKLRWASYQGGERSR